jgi:hypothetical protein
MSKDLEEYKLKRDKMLRTLNVREARAMVPGMADVDKEIVLGAMHKARVELTSMSDTLRHESMVWLKAHGWRRQFLMDWPADGSLPDPWK